MSNSVRPHRRKPTRLPRPWDSPGKNTGVGCHFLLQRMKVKSESEVDQSCPTLATPWTAAHQAPPSTGFSRQKYYMQPKKEKRLIWSILCYDNHFPATNFKYFVKHFTSTILETSFPNNSQIIKINKKKKHPSRL